jgi:hypothetical protein
MRITQLAEIGLDSGNTESNGLAALRKTAQSWHAMMGSHWVVLFEVMRRVILHRRVTLGENR